VKGDFVPLVSDSNSTINSSRKSRDSAVPRGPIVVSAVNLKFIFVGLGRVKVIQNAAEDEKDQLRKKVTYLEDGSFFGQDYFSLGIYCVLNETAPEKISGIPIIKVVSERVTLLVMDAKEFCGVMKSFPKEKDEMKKRLIALAQTKPTPLLRNLSISRHADASGLQSRVSGFLRNFPGENGPRKMESVKRVKERSPSPNRFKSRAPPSSTSPVVTQLQEILEKLQTDELELDSLEKSQKIVGKIQKQLLKIAVEQTKL